MSNVGLVLGSRISSGGKQQVIIDDIVPGGPSGLGAFVPVQAFGAKGDGVTVDGPAIQAATNALAGTGSQLWFPRGRYLVTPTPLNPKSNLTWYMADGAVLDANIPGATTTSCPVYYNFASLATSSTTVAAPGATLFSQILPVTSTAGIVAFRTWVGIFDRVLGIRGGIYQVIAVGPGTITVNRPILWPFAALDPISIFNAVGPDGVTNSPALTNFNIVSDGEALFEGQCVAYMNLVGAENCGIRGLRGAKGGSGTQISSDAGFAFQIGYRNWQQRIVIDGNSHNSPNKGVPLVAQEAFRSEDVTVIACDQNNYGIQDCVDCDFVDTRSYNTSGNGVVLGTETTAVSGINANRWIHFRGLTIIGAAGDGFALGVGDSWISVDGFLISDCGAVAIDVNSGAGLTSCVGNTFSNGVMQANQLAVLIPTHTSDTKLSNVVIEDSAAQDILQNAGATRVQIQNLTLNNTRGAGARAELHGDCTIDGLTGSFTVASTIVVEVQALGRVVVRGFDLTLPANSDAFYVPAGVLDVASGIARGSNAGTTGVQTNGGTARVGPNCNFTALGASFLNTTGFISRGAATGGVAVPWPDINVADRVLAYPTAANTPFHIVVTPGTGFTIVDGVGGAYDYAVT